MHGTAESSVELADDHSEGRHARLGAVLPIGPASDSFIRSQKRILTRNMQRTKSTRQSSLRCAACLWDNFRFCLQMIASHCLLQADGGVLKKILKPGIGWEKPEAGDQVFGKLTP